MRRVMLKEFSGCSNKTRHKKYEAGDRGCINWLPRYQDDEVEEVKDTYTFTARPKFAVSLRTGLLD